MNVIGSDNLHYKGARNGCARMLKDDETLEVQRGRLEVLLIMRIWRKCL